MNVDRDRQPETYDVEEPWPQPLTRTEAVRIFGEGALAVPRLTPVRVVALQLLCGACCAFFWWAAVGVQEALSALAGALVVAVPGGFFALRLHAAAVRGRMGLLQIMVGQIIKLVMTLLLFGLIVFKWPEVEWAPLILTVVLTVNVHWLALIPTGSKRKRGLWQPAEKRIPKY